MYQLICGLWIMEHKTLGKGIRGLPNSFVTVPHIASSRVRVYRFNSVFHWQHVCALSAIIIFHW